MWYYTGVVVCCILGLYIIGEILYHIPYWICAYIDWIARDEE
jgi:hypothetical protein